MTADLKALAKTTLDLNLSEAALAAFEMYAALIIAWNERVNLTSITDPDQIRIKHFLDSLSVLSLPNLPDHAHVIDVGTGAGLPGLALKIVRPDWRITLIDATGKKITFLREVIAELKLEGITAEQIRAEDAGQNLAHREQYDVVLARAVARLPILAEYLLPLCKVGGLCVAMKGETAQVEAADAEFAIRTLGGQLERLQVVELPEVDEKHYLVGLRKVSATPRAYPRRVGIAAKKPLGK